MRKLTKNQLAKVSKNLDHYFNLATDQQINEGLNWYKNANQFFNDIVTSSESKQYFYHLHIRNRVDRLFTQTSSTIHNERRRINIQIRYIYSSRRPMSIEIDQVINQYTQKTI